MTKLEILKGYTPAQIRDSYVALGSLQATNAARMYSKDQIYRVAQPSSALDGYLLFCSEELIGIAAWDVATLTDYAYGEISFADGIISPNFTLLLTNDEFVSIVPPVDDSFIPFVDAIAASDTVQIPETELYTILTDIGVPFIQMSELEYSPAQINDLMIKPALEEYFKWFPKVEVQQYAVNTTAVQEWEFPTGAYDVVHIGINQGITQGGSSNILLRYFDEVVWSAQSPTMGHVGGRRSPRTNMGDFGAMMMDRAVRQGMINYSTRVHHTVISRGGKKYVSAYTNKSGSVQVHYAMRTLNWDDVEFARKPELRELARSYVLRAFGTLRSQAKSDIPGAVDYSNWVSTANDIKKNVIEEWKQLVKTSGIIRGSM